MLPQDFQQCTDYGTILADLNQFCNDYIPIMGRFYANLNRFCTDYIPIMYQHCAGVMY